MRNQPPCSEPNALAECDSSVMSQQFVAFQQVEERSDARRAGAGLTCAHSSAPDTADGRLLSGLTGLARRERPRSATTALQLRDRAHYALASASCIAESGAL